MAGKPKIYNPDTLGAPLGQYSHCTRAGDMLFIAGMLAANKKGESVGGANFEKQTDQVFANVEAALRSAGAGWGAVAQFTTYLVSPKWIPEFFKWRLKNFPRLFPDGKYPPNTLLIVSRLVKPEFLVEVQTIAVVGKGAAKKKPAKKKPAKRARR